MAKELYDGLKKIVTIEDRIQQLTESVKGAHVRLENHAERLARLEGKFELIETLVVARRRKLAE